MANSTKFVSLHRFFSDHRRLIATIRYHSPFDRCKNYYSIDHGIYMSFQGKRCLSSNAEWSTQSEFTGTNAYDLLGVSQTSSFQEIKTSFRKLAKENHPDMVHSQSHSSDASKKFIQILAAYEILSDFHKRAHYDRHLLSQRTCVGRNTKQDPIVYNYNSYGHTIKQMEVVEWLKWYRCTVYDILSERRVTAGSGYFDVLERDFYSALHVAFYGPEIERAELLPSCFEADERSEHTTSEVLHLVSGRDLFGMVCLADCYTELSHTYHEKLKSSDLGLVQAADSGGQLLNTSDDDDKDSQKQFSSIKYQSSDAHRDLELHISGRVIAVASRVLPKSCSGKQSEEFEDQIHVYLTTHDHQLHSRKECPQVTLPNSSTGFGLALGTIKGLGTSTEEGTCDVYNSVGIKTHVIMKHRTMMVKHLHWYRIGEKISVCECRCSRARLPPSKFWLFEPRSSMHDIGGWYVETYGRDKKGKNVPAQRCWDGLHMDEQFEERLHPAIYLFALAYRTLDLENMRKTNRTIKDKIEINMSRIFSWCRSLV